MRLKLRHPDRQSVENRNGTLLFSGPPWLGHLHCLNNLNNLNSLHILCSLHGLSIRFSKFLQSLQIWMLETWSDWRLEEISPLSYRRQARHQKWTHPDNSTWPSQPKAGLRPSINKNINIDIDINIDLFFFISQVALGSHWHYILGYNLLAPEIQLSYLLVCGGIFCLACHDIGNTF